MGGPVVGAAVGHVGEGLGAASGDAALDAGDLVGLLDAVGEPVELFGEGLGVVARQGDLGQEAVEQLGDVDPVAVAVGWRGAVGGDGVEPVGDDLFGGPQRRRGRHLVDQDDLVVGERRRRAAHGHPQQQVEAVPGEVTAAVGVGEVGVAGQEPAVVGDPSGVPAVHAVGRQELGLVHMAVLLVELAVAVHGRQDLQIGGGRLHGPDPLGDRRDQLGVGQQQGVLPAEHLRRAHTQSLRTPVTLIRSRDGRGDERGWPGDKPDPGDAKRRRGQLDA